VAALVGSVTGALLTALDDLLDLFRVGAADAPAGGQSASTPRRQPST
jgi:hypothetical protein